MKRLLKIAALAVLSFILVCGISFLTDKNHYSGWELKSKKGNPVIWAPFEWTSETLNGKYYEKTSMNIPCTVEGFPNTFTFQFDLGAFYTGVYEHTYADYSNLTGQKNGIQKLKSPLQFWNHNKCINGLTLHFGDYSATSKTAFVYRNFGIKLEKIDPNDTIHLGTIGNDLFQNKVLIIDYPNQQFAVCDEVPGNYKMPMVNIELDKAGRVILPMIFHGKSYRILFDNGSSLFPLLVPAKNISIFSSLPDTDTLTISSWGKLHDVTGKMLNDSFQLAGQPFAHTKIYANHTGYGINDQTDGTAGNALFWNNTVVIDFRNRKMGVR